VGRLVRQCEDEKLELHTLPLSAFTAAHALFAQDVFDALSAHQSVELREVDGGTGPSAVRAQLEAAQKALE
jgi:argininosuccinate lyase